MRLILAALLLTGCATQSITTGVDPEDMVYLSDTPGNDVWRTDQPSHGDCEDYALGMARKIGGEYLVVVDHEDTDHAVLVSKGKTYDNLNLGLKLRELEGYPACNLSTGKIGFYLSGSFAQAGKAAQEFKFGRNCAKAVAELKGGREQ